MALSGVACYERGQHSKKLRMYQISSPGRNGKRGLYHCIKPHKYSDGRQQGVTTHKKSLTAKIPAGFSLAYFYGWFLFPYVQLVQFTSLGLFQTDLFIEYLLLLDV